MNEIATYTFCITSNFGIICMAVWLTKQIIQGVRHIAKSVVEEEKEIDKILESKDE